MPTINETRGKLIGFAFLPNGWHFNEGVPAKEQTLRTALILLGDLEKAGFTRTDAYPGADGSVMVSAYESSDSYDFSIRPSGAITVTHDRGDEELFYQEKMTEEEVREKIKEFGLSTCHTPDYLILGTTIAVTTGNLRATPFKTQRTGQESLSSVSNAPDVNPVVFANTLPVSTNLLPARPSSFGRSRKRSSKAVGV